MSKKYILQKHLPGVNAGHRFSPVSALAYAFIDNKRGIHIELENELVENNPDWFAPEKLPMELAWDRVIDSNVWVHKFEGRAYHFKRMFEMGWIEAEKHWMEKMNFIPK